MEAGEKEINHTQKNKTKILSKILKWSFWLMTSIIIIICIASFTIFLYQDELKKLAIKKINENIQTKIILKPENIDVTFIKTFPDVCLRFNDATVLETQDKPDRDTIINAGKILFHFNLIDILRKKYIINKVSLSNSSIKLKIDNEGNKNFIFWKPDTLKPKENNSTVEFQINSFKISNVKIEFQDFKKNIFTSGQINDITIDGNFKDEIKDLKAEGEFLTNNFQYIKEKYNVNKNISFKSTIKIKNDCWQVEDIRLSVDELNLKFSGNLKYENNSYLSDLKFEILDMNLSKITPFINDSIKKQIEKYQPLGEINLNGKINGNILNYRELSIYSEFESSGMNLVYGEKKIKLEDINFNGNFKKEPNRKEILVINKLDFSIIETRVRTAIKIENFNEPFVVTQFNLQGELNDIAQLATLDSIESVKGKINLKGSFKGTLEKIKTDFLKTAPELLASLEDASIKIKGIPSEINIKKAEIQLTDNSFNVKDFEISSEENTISINGKTDNFNNWLEKNTKKEFNGTITGKEIVWDKISKLFPENKTSNSKEDSENLIDDRLSIKINLNLDNLVVQRINFERLKGNIEIKKGKVLCEDMSFKQSDGEIRLKCLIEKEKDKISFKGKSELANVNISETFKNFNDFNQTTLTNKNLKGKTDAKIEFIANFDKNNNLDTKSFKANGLLNVKSGELINFAPLEGLGKFVEIKELKNIKFSDMETSFEISEEQINLPKTIIGNSALNLTVSGFHKFNQDLEYKLSVKLSELIAKRPGKKRELDDELSAVEDDPENKRKIFIRIYGNLDDIHYKYDRASVKQKIKEDIKAEKNNLKNILREEFGWFKKDTLNIKKGKKEKKQYNDEPQFKFEDSNSSQESKDDDF